ncbi:hypothetical protein [Streptomyces sp. NBC_01750]|uniref:hypothetical protein n=1 Tax=Streptomyces sp. NBC_01750 TaxID=2975928 RepID=UPI002DD9281F|nr:hypothetical protein [Streptomyces sp. NBC_01750]WSD32288.1 hypothetical protein OG966_10430 [Streptomyces sp. NBC_01750]
MTGSAAAKGIDRVRIGGELVTWRTPEAAYALGLRYAAYPPHYPAVRLRPGQRQCAGVAHSEGDTKAAGSRSVIRVVRADRLPKPPKCG